MKSALSTRNTAVLLRVRPAGRGRWTPFRRHQEGDLEVALRALQDWRAARLLRGADTTKGVGVPPSRCSVASWRVPASGRSACRKIRQDADALRFASTTAFRAGAHAPTSTTGE